MRIARVAAVSLLCSLVLSACGGHAQNAASPASTEPASEAPSTVASAVAAAQASPAPAESLSPTPAPTPTPDPNLLSWKNGAILRSYPAAAFGTSPDTNGIAEGGPSYQTGATGPYTFVYELPGPATITAFTADLPQPVPSAAPASVAFATSQTGPNGSFQPAGTITASASPGPQQIAANVTARWIQVTANGPAFRSVGAIGSLAPLPSGVSPAGIYVELDAEPTKNGAFNPVPTSGDPWYRAVSIFGSGMTAVRCFDGHFGDAYPGSIDGRTWTLTGSGDRGFVNEDASMIVGSQGGDPFYLLRTAKQPKYCVPRESGAGSRRVLVLDSNGMPDVWPFDDPTHLPGYAYERIGAGMLDAPALAGKDIAILNGLCDSSTYLSAGQGSGLLDWVSAGHTLLIYDSDMCGKSVYGFIPYQFTTSNPGAHGAAGHRLIIVENDALGSGDKTDAAHYLDVAAWVKDTGNQIGDANTVTSNDPHWCGHLFGTNVENVNGFMEMYAPYGKGTIVYSGFDHDDGGEPSFERLHTLEFGLPEPNDLPCTQKVAGSFVIQPNQEGTFTAGTASTPSFTMELLANQGWKGHVSVATAGDFQAAVTPSSFDVAGGTQPLNVVVTVPASAKPGAYTVTVTGTGDGGMTASASITFTGTAPIKKVALQKHQRIRIYGIHFDYDSARIQPRSQPVIADIAAMMKANPAWHFEVSGHTDSDGGAAYNLGLSQRRAQSVVNDLVTRYGIARSRLVPKGYGLSRPVASNATDAGKALNRRVELERTQ